MTAVVTLEGLEHLLKSLGGRLVAVDLAVRSGLYMAGQQIMAESVRHTPLDFGTLRGSAYVALPTGETPVVEIGYGGAAKDYVVVQHEDTGLEHPEPGTHAKFLEKALHKNRQRALAYVAKQVKKALEGKAPPLSRGQFPAAPASSVAKGPGRRTRARQRKAVNALRRKLRARRRGTP